MIIKRIKIKEYKQFKNVELDFKDGLNIIIGGNGTGKTTLFNMLKEGILNKNKDYTVEIGGEADKRHIDYVFVDLDKFSEKITNQCQTAMGEKILLALGKVLGDRSANDIQAPLILDSPVCRLDEEKRMLFFKILRGLNTQVIVFAHEMDLRDTGLKADFRLENKDEDRRTTIIQKIR